MLKEQKTSIFVLCIVAILSISLATPVAEAALDIDWIAIHWSKHHLDGTPDADPWVFEMWVDFVDTGDLDHVDATTPGSQPPFHTVQSTSGNRWFWWSYSDYSSLTDLLAVYQEGIYTFEFRDSTDALLRTVTLDCSNLPDVPSNPVDFTYPSTDGQTDVPLNPTFTWTVDSGAGEGLGMVVQYSVTPYDQIYENIPVSMSTTSWAPGPLLANHSYVLSVGVGNGKDLGVGPTLPTMIVDD